MSSDRTWTDRRIEVVIGNLLRAGVLLSAFVVLFGAAIYLVRHGLAPTDYRVFRGEPSDLRSVGGILRNAHALRGRGIIQLGLLLLIATPIARVGFSIFGFAEEHDRMYVVVASIVLLILVYSLIGSTGLHKQTLLSGGPRTFVSHVQAHNLVSDGCTLLSVSTAETSAA